ncbi:putative phosphatase regulatory subunit-domain-containing protein, partial [Lactarius psammicola]
SNSPPSSPKSVRFKDKDGELESVCLFRATGRPSSISHPRSHSDTETETETDSALAAAQRASNVGTMTFTMAEISPIPSPHTPPELNVHLESIALLPARPPILRGIVRVRNIAFEKSVTARFTTDGWTTTSEAQARYAGPAAAADADDWDVFAFTIPLEAPPSSRTLLLAVRYAVPGTGEWWDNNGGADFRIVLAPKTPPSPPSPRPAPVPG